ncbi:MAG TPA: phosphatase PAP2 family protein [Solirubrobacteraceae bacterium]|nr:phosphatase PAP2 family protein [Solirubrobacteraceae bacterium]
MRARALMAFRAAGGGAVALAVLWFATFHIGVVRHVDRSILIGFADLHRPRVDTVTNFVAGLCNPRPYLLLVAVPVIVAVLRRRPRHAAGILAIVLGANLTTQILKPLLAAPRPHLIVDGFPLTINAASWPSGHATAAMALCLSAVLAAPSRWRPRVGALMAVFAIAVCYSFLELTWHFPSDVLGGFMVASIWGLAGAGVLFWAEERWPSGHGVGGEGREPVSIASVLRPAGGVVAACGAVVAGVALARPHAVIGYASGHSAFVLGALAIAVSGLAIAGGASLALTRGGPGGVGGSGPGGGQR